MFGVGSGAVESYAVMSPMPTSSARMITMFGFLADGGSSHRVPRLSGRAASQWPPLHAVARALGGVRKISIVKMHISGRNLSPSTGP